MRNEGIEMLILTERLMIRNFTKRDTAASDDLLEADVDKPRLNVCGK